MSTLDTCLTAKDMEDAKKMPKYEQIKQSCGWTVD